MNGSKRFTSHHAIVKKELKGEDVVFVVEEMWVGEVRWSMYCICDGHGGVAAADFVKENLPTMLPKELHADPPPSNFRNKEGRNWAKRVSEVVATVFCAMDEAFAHTSAPSGTTISVALICGSLLTIGNVGDSEVFLDALIQILPMTKVHKVDTNVEEQSRLHGDGALISTFLSSSGRGSLMPHKPIGPLRVWPGGIAISRSLGDFDCSPHVISNPHITQAILPEMGSRLILATDGLWDHMSGKKACRIARKCLLARAPTRVFRSLMAITKNCLVDDTTILIVDIMPSDISDTDFSLLCTKEGIKKSVWSRMRKLLSKIPGLGRKQIGLYACVDSAISFPTIKSNGHAIFREMVSNSVSSRGMPSIPSTSRRRIEIYNEQTNQWSPDSDDDLLPQPIPHHLVAQGV